MLDRGKSFLSGAEHEHLNFCGAGHKNKVVKSEVRNYKKRARHVISWDFLDKLSDKEPGLI